MGRDTATLRAQFRELGRRTQCLFANWKQLTAKICNSSLMHDSVLSMFTETPACRGPIFLDAFFLYCTLKMRNDGITNTAFVRDLQHQEGVYKVIILFLLSWSITHIFHAGREEFQLSAPIFSAINLPDVSISSLSCCEKDNSNYWKWGLRCWSGCLAHLEHIKTDILTRKACFQSVARKGLTPGLGRA